ncbi:MAG TPA: acetolactate synthase [Opitutus sp.]|nr:acetolactate synthase [Opitutus sp.]
MSAPNLSIGRDPVKQFSIFAENRVGRLNDLVGLFKQNDVHIMAITVLDTTDSAIVRVIVDDPEKARELMVNNDFPYTECEVLVVEIRDESKLRNVLGALFVAEINVHYVYSFIKRPDNEAALVLNVEDSDVAAQALSRCGFKVITQRDISR